MDQVLLETERLALDMPQEPDVPYIYAYCQDKLIQAYTTVPQPYGLDDAVQFVKRTVPAGWESGSELTWAIRRKHEPTLLGIVSLRDWNDSQVMVGFWLGAPWRGEGYVAEALSALADFVFDGRFRGAGGAVKDTIVWEAMVGNVSSAIVAKKAGFRYLGRRPGELERFGEFPDSYRAELTSERDGAADSWPAEAFAR